MEPVKDDCHFFIMIFDDKDFYGSDNIGSALVDLGELMLHKGHLHDKTYSHWFPILFKNKQIG